MQAVLLVISHIVRDPWWSTRPVRCIRVSEAGAVTSMFLSTSSIVDSMLLSSCLDGCLRIGFGLNIRCTKLPGFLRGASWRLRSHSRFQLSYFSHGTWFIICRWLTNVMGQLVAWKERFWNWEIKHRLRRNIFLAGRISEFWIFLWPEFSSDLMQGSTAKAIEWLWIWTRGPGAEGTGCVSWVGRLSIVVFSGWRLRFSGWSDQWRGMCLWMRSRCHLGN